MLRPALSRAGAAACRIRPVAAATAPAQFRSASTAISNPTLSNIEGRWDALPPQEQADLWMALRDRMKVNWHELTPQEKKAAYYIAFGPHGPRADAPPGETKKILFGVFLALVASGTVFGTVRHFAGPGPKTMSKEWQEATNKYMQEERIEPITGPGQEGYTGTGMIQSKSTGLVMENAEEDEDDE